MYGLNCQSRTGRSDGKLVNEWRVVKVVNVVQLVQASMYMHELWLSRQFSMQDIYSNPHRKISKIRFPYSPVKVPAYSTVQLPVQYSSSSRVQFRLFQVVSRDQALPSLNSSFVQRNVNLNKSSARLVQAMHSRILESTGSNMQMRMANIEPPQYLARHNFALFTKRTTESLQLREWMFKGTQS
jgi:hypothetical protein